MYLPQDLYPSLERVPWLAFAGRQPQSQFEFPVTYVRTAELALEGFNSALWSDAKTEAQGDLNGYLAKHHYNSYGGHWNNLAKQSHALVEQAVGAKLAAALNGKVFPAEMLQPILTDINRAMLEVAYRRKFPKVPIFLRDYYVSMKQGGFRAAGMGR